MIQFVMGEENFFEALNVRIFLNSFLKCERFASRRRYFKYPSSSLIAFP